MRGTHVQQLLVTDCAGVVADLTDTTAEIRNKRARTWMLSVWPSPAFTPAWIHRAVAPRGVLTLVGWPLVGPASVPDLSERSLEPPTRSVRNSEIWAVKDRESE